jgi:hypothetical protein
MELDRLLDPGHERDSIVLLAAELLGSSDADRGDDLVGELRERVSDDGRIVLAVDDCERAGSS